MKRKEIDDYIQLANLNNITWVGPVLPENVRTKTEWKCYLGHIWFSRYSVISSGSGCPKCAILKRLKTAQDYIDLAIKRNIEWIDVSVPYSISDKTMWLCQSGHKFKSRYNDIKNGHGCIYCANQVPKTKDDYIALATNHNLVWLGIVPKNTGKKTNWQCSLGHIWSSNYNNIYNGNGCPVCYKNNHCISKDDYIKIAKDKGFVWVGKFPANTRIKTTWQCSNKHQWEAIYHSIYQGSGCPYCLDLENGIKVSSQQRAICKMVGGELNFKVASKYIDIALPQQKIAIEYDSWYWHGDKLDSDLKRVKTLILYGWRVLSIKSNLEVPTKEQLYEALVHLEQIPHTSIILQDWGKGKIFKRNGNSREK